MFDYYIDKPILINILDLDFKIIQKYTFKPSIKGKGSDDNESNKDETNEDELNENELFTDEDLDILNDINVSNIQFSKSKTKNINKQIQDNNVKVENINSIIFFKTDTIKTFKTKLAIYLNISPTHIHIVNNDLIDIFLNDLQYEQYKEEKLYDIPIDHNLYEQKSMLNINIYDNAKYLIDILEINKNKEYTLNLFILDEIIQKNNQKLISSVKTDIEIFNIIYVSFILKYFPYLHRDKFYSWITNLDITQNLNDGLNDGLNSNIDISKYKKQIDYENKIYNKLDHLNNNKVNDYINKHYFIKNEYIFIKSSVPKSNIEESSLNLIDLNTKQLFNSIEISKIPNLTHIKYQDFNYEVLKYNKYINFVNKNESDFKLKLGDLVLYFKDFIIYINLKYEYSIHIYKDWDIHLLFNKIDKYINSILEILHLRLITKTNYVIEKINYCFVFKTNINNNNYENIISNLELLINSSHLIELNDELFNTHNLLNPKSYKSSSNVAFSNKIYYLDKLSVNIHPDFLDYPKSINEISHLREVHFQISNQKLYIKLHNINYKEYPIIESFFYHYLYYLKDSIYKKESIDYNKISLRNIDPIIFDAEYSRICQKKYQPVVIDKDEISKYEPSRYVKYKNQFTNDDEYYYCPNSQFPYIKFLKGIHNYCLPCCKQKNNAQFPSYKKIHESCLKEYIYKEDDDNNNQYITNYAHHIFSDRIMKLPTSLNFLNLDIDKYYVYAPKRMLQNHNVDIIFILAYILNKTEDELIIDMIKHLKKNTYIYYTLITQITNNLYATFDDFVQSILNIFIYKEVSNTFIDFNLIFMQLSIFYNIKCIILNNNTFLTMQSSSIPNLTDNYKKIFIIEEEGYHNLIIDLNASKTTFNFNDDITQQFINITNIFKSDFKQYHTNYNQIILNDILEFAKSQNDNITYHLDKYNVCIGLLLNNFYLPISSIDKIDNTDSFNNSFTNSSTISHNDNILDLANIQLQSIKFIFDFVHKYNRFVYKKESINNKAFSSKILSEYLKKIKSDNILDYSLFGSYLRIISFIIVKNKVIGLNINSNIIYCQETELPLANKLLNNEQHNITLNIKNVEYILTRTLIIKPNHNYNYVMRYHPMMITNELTKLNKVQNNLTRYINNIYQKNLYKLFLSQINHYYNKKLNVKKILEKIKKYNLNNVTTHNIKTTLDLFSYMSDSDIQHKILKNKKLFELQQDPYFKYTDTLFIQSCKNEGIYCHNKKLIITKQNLTDLITIFINDIKNEYRKKYIISSEYYENLNSLYTYNTFLNETIILTSK